MRAPRGHPCVDACTGLLFPSGVLVGCCVRVTILHSQSLELPLSVVGQDFCGGPACGSPVFACDAPLRPPRRHNGRRGEPR